MTGAAQVPELLRRVRRLEVVARENAAALLAGDYVTSIPGRGLLFREPRKYVAGEDARRIDWNITARLGEPYVRVHHEERRREVWLALDVSPSMHTGFQEKTKLEVAVELAATLAVSAIDAGDRLGWVVFADRALEVARPRGGRSQLFAALRSFLAHAGPWDRAVAESDPRAAIHAVQRHRGSRFVVFLLSDFIDHDVPEDLKYVRARHDLALLHVYDPVEYAASDAVRFAAVSPEGRRRRRGLLAPGEAGSLEEIEGFLREKAARLGIAVSSFSTAVSVPDALGSFFHRRRRRPQR